MHDSRRCIFTLPSKPHAAWHSQEKQMTGHMKCKDDMIACMYPTAMLCTTLLQGLPELYAG
jgi:hypothetical protein